MKAFRQQVLTELMLYTRSVGSLAWSFIFPIFVIFSLGFYFSGDGNPVKIFIGLSDEDDHLAAWQLYWYLQLEPQQFEVYKGSKTQIDSLLMAGHFTAAVYIPPGFTASTATQQGKVTIEYNAYMASQIPLVKQFLEKSILRLNQDYQHEQPAIAWEEKTISSDENTGSYLDFLIPGMIGLQVMSASLWGVGFLLISYREKGNLKQLALTPMRKSVFISAFIVSRFLFQMLQVVFILVCSFLVFPVHMKGDWFSFMLAVSLGSLVFMSIGFLIASLADTVELAIGINNILFFLMIGLSGVFFSVENLPSWAQTITQLFPLTHFIQALRGIFNEGEPIWHLGKPLLVLTGWLALGFFLSVKRFKWY